MISTVKLMRCMYYEIYQYQSPYYDIMEFTTENAAAWLIITSSYDDARYNSVWWAGARRGELSQQRIVEQKASELVTARATLVILQAQLAAGMDVQTQIDQIELEINILANCSIYRL